MVKEQCTYCEGMGEVVCDECDGEGSVVCYDCEGTGRGELVVSEDDEGFDECPSCDDGFETCDDCGGEGMVDCYECGGEGEISPTDV